MTEHIPPIRARTDVMSGNSKAMMDVMNTKLRVMAMFLIDKFDYRYCGIENLVVLFILNIRIPLSGI